MGILDIIKNKRINATIPESVAKSYYTKHPGTKIICKAPFSSLYFHPDGEVGACCLNRKVYNYGFYKKNNISEIIKSEKRLNHQKHLSANNYSLGCRICESSLKAGNYSGLLANIYQKFSLKNKIQRIDFELSYHCNFDCIMCERDKSYYKSEIYNEEFFNEIKPILRRIKFANFLGGEPFLIPIYYDIWNFLLKSNPNCMITVQSNGSIFNDKVEKLLKNRNFHVGISIDTMNEEMFEKIRRKSQFKTVIQNLYKFGQIMSKKGSFLQISICPMRMNYKDIPEIIEFANSNKNVIFFNQVFYPPYLNLKTLKSSELKEILHYYTETCNTLPENAEHEIINKNAYKDLINLISLWHQESILREIESKYLTKESILEIIIAKDKNYQNHKEIINEIISILPDNLLCSAEMINDIENLNYSEIFDIDCSNDFEKDEVIKKTLVFFGLYTNTDIEGYE